MFLLDLNLNVQGLILDFHSKPTSLPLVHRTHVSPHLHGARLRFSCVHVGPSSCITMLSPTNLCKVGQPTCLTTLAQSPHLCNVEPCLPHLTPATLSHVHTTSFSHPLHPVSLPLACFIMQTPSPRRATHYTTHHLTHHTTSFQFPCYLACTHTQQSHLHLILTETDTQKKEKRGSWLLKGERNLYEKKR